MEKTVVALFDNLDTAQAAVQQLLDSGFSRDIISVVRTNQQAGTAGSDAAEGNAYSTSAAASGAAAGAGIGAILGGLAGLLVGLGALAIPGIGPIIAAGPIATTLAGVGLGAATGGLVGALADAGIPERDASAYAEGVRRGGTLVTVRADQDQALQATEILNRFTPVDINQRAGEWQASGWSGYDAAAGPYSTSSGAPHTHQAAEMAQGPSPRADEGDSSGYVVDTGLRGENSGGVDEDKGARAYTGPASFTSSTERWESYDAPGSTTRPDEDRTMRSGHGAMSTSGGLSAGEGGTYERIQEHDSAVHPRSSEGDYQARRDLLNESDEAAGSTVSPRAGQDYDRTMAGMSRSFDTYDQDFRTDWQRSFSSSGYRYERYQPAYQYGYHLATDAKYRSQDWSGIESEARRGWEMRHPNDAWEDFKDAVRHAWDRVRTGVNDSFD